MAKEKRFANRYDMERNMVENALMDAKKEWGLDIIPIALFWEHLRRIKKENDYEPKIHVDFILDVLDVSLSTANGMVVKGARKANCYYQK